MIKKTKKEILQQLGYTVNKGNLEKQMLFENIISQAMDEWAKQQINLNLGNVIKWVACSDMMPNTEGEYLCRRRYKGIISIEIYYPEHPENWINFTGVTHWSEIKPPCL